MTDMCDICGKKADQVGGLHEYIPPHGETIEVKGYYKREKWSVCDVCDPGDSL